MLLAPDKLIPTYAVYGIEFHEQVDQICQIFIVENNLKYLLDCRQSKRLPVIPRVNKEWRVVVVVILRVNRYLLC